MMPGQSDDRILGGPSWVQTHRFDVDARAGHEVSREQASAMLRALLEDRFKLVVATEQRLRNAFVLRLARADGRLGPALKKAANGCEAIRPKVVLSRPSNASQGAAGDSIFTAAEEQLGLKLERRREPAPYDVLVIKSVDQPSEN